MVNLFALNACFLTHIFHNCSNSVFFHSLVDKPGITFTTFINCTLYDIPDDNNDDLLVRSSQQIVEQTLGEIENYEHNLLDIRNQNMSTSIPKPPCC
jgi:hypothetical protein